MRSGMNDSDARAITQKLRGLPVEAAPPYDWAEFQRRSSSRRLGEPRAPASAAVIAGTPAPGGRRAALAAGFAVLVASMALWVRFDSDRRVVAEQPGPALDEQTLDVTRSATNHGDAASQWLASLPDEPAIVRVDTRFAVADLEDRIAWLDDVLTAAQLESGQGMQVTELRRERAQLVNSLAQVRYAETLAAELP